MRLRAGRRAAACRRLALASREPMSQQFNYAAPARIALSRRSAGPSVYDERRCGVPDGTPNRRPAPNERVRCEIVTTLNHDNVERKSINGLVTALKLRTSS